MVFDVSNTLLRSVFRSGELYVFRRDLSHNGRLQVRKSEAVSFSYRQSLPVGIITRSDLTSSLAVAILM